METGASLCASLTAKGGQFDARFARSIFGDVHAAAENDPSPFRAHMARNSARLFDKQKTLSGDRVFLRAEKRAVINICPR